MAEILDSPEEVLSTLGSDGRRRWIYPVLNKGPLYWKRFVVAWGLMAIFIAMPMIKIGDKPSIFLDVVHREFTFFGVTLYATDTFLLTLFLLSSFVFILWFTALAGRVWCGWGCPQTVYLEFVFRPVERFFEGKESVRKRRDEAAMNFDKAWRKTGKFTVYSLISVFLAHTFVAYFVSWDRLLAWMTGPPTEHWGFFVMMAGTSGLILFDFAYFREQMCTIACPYARIQSVLQDKDSLIVSYDPSRGEARGRRNKKQREAEARGEDIGLGDCIDCMACVRTCPTGIDIREGLQMECISCTQCVDACDDIMGKIGKPLGLIRYTSENALEKSESHVLRPRMILYTIVFAIVFGAFSYKLATRTPIDFNVGRVVGAPFLPMDDAHVMNRVRFRVQNRTGADSVFTVKTSQPEGLQVKMIGKPELSITEGATDRIEAFVIVPKDKFENGKLPATFEVSNGDVSTTFDFTLLGP